MKNMKKDATTKQGATACGRVRAIIGGGLEVKKAADHSTADVKIRDSLEGAGIKCNGSRQKKNFAS